MLSLNRYTRLFTDHYTKALEAAKNDRILKWIGHKIRHSYGVLAAAQRIVSSDELLKNQPFEVIKCLEIAALLHDVGRFYQVDGEHILKGDEFDHGLKGYEVAKADGVKDLRILLAIKYHNKFDISSIYQDKEYLGAGTETQSQILVVLKGLRDSDKMQNLEYILFDNGRGMEKFDEVYFSLGSSNDISQEMINTIYEKHYAKFEKAKNFGEMLIHYIGWIFDINYKGTLRILANSGLKVFLIERLGTYGVSMDQLSRIQNVLDEYI